MSISPRLANKLTINKYSFSLCWYPCGTQYEFLTGFSRSSFSLRARSSAPPRNAEDKKPLFVIPPGDRLDLKKIFLSARGTFFTERWTSLHTSFLAGRPSALLASSGECVLVEACECSSLLLLFTESDLQARRMPDASMTKHEQENWPS